MCLALYRPATVSAKPLDYDLFQRAHRRNDDGMGAMWSEGGRLHILKSIEASPYNFYQQMKDVLERPVPVAIHFRLATHGKHDLENCHPVMVNDSLAMMHNGILGKLPRCQERSDTRILAEDWLRRMPKQWWKNPVMLAMLEDFIGGGNKLILMHRSGRTAIVNPKAGTELDGIWYSNLLWRSTVVPATTFPGAHNPYDSRWNRRSDDGQSDHYWQQQARAQRAAGESWSDDEDGWMDADERAGALAAARAQREDSDARILFDRRASDPHTKKSSDTPAALPPPVYGYALDSGICICVACAADTRTHGHEILREADRVHVFRKGDPDGGEVACDVCGDALDGSGRNAFEEDEDADDDPTEGIFSLGAPPTEAADFELIEPNPVALPAETTKARKIAEVLLRSGTSTSSQDDTQRTDLPRATPRIVAIVMRLRLASAQMRSVTSLPGPEANYFRRVDAERTVEAMARYPRLRR